MDSEFPQYGFAEHKGYCTPVHDGALAEHGPSPVHRYSFVNVRAARDGIDVADDELPEGLVHNGSLAVGLSEVAVGGGWGQ